MPFSDTRGFVLSAAACAVVLALSGCGGGGGGASTTPPPGRSMAQLDPEPVALPEGVTLARAGTFTIEPGESVDRDGARFTCAAGGPACAVVVAERAGGGYLATVTGGEVMVAAAQLPAPPVGGGQPGGMEETGAPFPDWPVADAAAARSLVGGSALSWSPSEIENRIGATVGLPRVSSDDPDWCTSHQHAISHHFCNVEYQPVMTYQHGGDIPIFQARAMISTQREVAIGGILDHGYFLVARQFDVTTDVDEVIGARARAPHFLPDGLGPGTETGRWQGALVGTGNSATSPLYSQFIIGDVDVTVELQQGQFFQFSARRDFSVEFSNVRNINTGATVTLSRMQWNWVGGEGTSVDERRREGFPTLVFYPENRNDPQRHEEVFGTFRTEEALGAFGAKKQ